MKKRQLRRKEKVYTEKVPKQKKIHSKKSSEMDLVFGFISLFFRGLGIFSIHENEGSSVVFER
ncbi:hypothetical protein [Enterococcus faecium]|uniref:hypothetical protein n=1 Tax=Enterococcus faecium TaxID=1352 RepID=UPI003F89A65C